MIRKEGSIVVGWFFDDESHFDNYSKWWIPYLDYCVTNAIQAVPKYREKGARVVQTLINTGIAVNVDWPNIKEIYDVSFVGRASVDRTQAINELKQRNMPIHLFGEGYGGYVSFERMIEIFQTSKINLNFSRATRYTEFQIKGRIFEVCLAAGFLLTEYAPGIENYFEVGKEIVCFHDVAEMTDKITYYLKHEAERRAIAQAGWERATREYTSARMVTKAFAEIEEDLVARGRNSSRYPQKLKTPLKMCREFSAFYLQLAVGYSLENYKGLWKDAFALSLSYNPFDLRAWGYYVISFLPPFVQSSLVELYQALYYRSGPIPYLKKIKRSLAKRLFHT